MATSSAEGSAAIGLFNKAAVMALLISLVVHGLQLRGAWNPWLLFLCNFGIIIGLALVAIRAHRASDGDFDSAVAAETIVAFGVLALILGLATAIVPVLVLDTGSFQFNRASVAALGGPFVQGLCAAALAPVVAVLLRNFSAEHGRGTSTADELAQLSRVAGRLAGELGLAKAAAAELTRAINDAAGATARLGPELVGHLDGVATATAQLAPTLTAGTTQIATSLDATGKQLAAGLADARTQMDAMSQAARQGTGDLAGLGTELKQLRAGAVDTGELLDALGALIVSADRFVAARAPSPPPVAAP